MGVIAGLLLLNAVVGFIQDFQAGNIVQELKRTLAQNCTVLRNGGVLAELDVFSLVPGDIIYLDEVILVEDSSPRGRILTGLTLTALGHYRTSGRYRDHS